MEKGMKVLSTSGLRKSLRGLRSMKGLQVGYWEG